MSVGARRPGRTTVARAPAVVEIREPDRPAQQLPVTALLVIGRGRDGYAVLDRRVSRRHLELAFRSGVLTVTDLGSRHGTRLNGEPLLGPKALRAGDTIRLGD